MPWSIVPFLYFSLYQSFMMSLSKCYSHFIIAHFFTIYSIISLFFCDDFCSTFLWDLSQDVHFSTYKSVFILFNISKIVYLFIYSPLLKYTTYFSVHLIIYITVGSSRCTTMPGPIVYFLSFSIIRIQDLLLCEKLYALFFIIMLQVEQYLGHEGYSNIIVELFKVTALQALRFIL